MNTPTPEQAPRTYTVGTLTYSRSQLGKVFFWMLWGDFVLTLMDGGVVAKVLQVQLKALGASNATIGFLGGTVTALLSAVGVAIISTASDRHRGPRGRRMPFMLYTAPPLALCLLAVGFSDVIAGWLQNAAPALASKFAWLAANTLPGASGLPASAHLVLAVMTSMLILYRIFDLFPGTIYYCLWADVIPSKVIGAFACCFRIVAGVGMFLFNYFLLQYADTHARWLYAGAAALYLVSFTALSLFVREGEYPPPPEPRGNTVLRVIEYFKTSYASAFYWKFYLMTGSFIIAVKSLQSFDVLFGKQYTNDPGKLLSYNYLITLIPFFALAGIIDRIHPLRAGLVALILVLASGIAGFFLIHDKLTFLICITCTYVAIAVYQAATGAINVRILPRDRFGQFNSANVMFWQVCWAVASIACGHFLDVVKDYRYVMLWFSVFMSISLVMMVLVYRHWKRLGGDERYVAPVPGQASAPVQ